MLASLRSAFSSTGSSTEPIGLFGLGTEKESPSDQFASWLPYQSYLEDEQLFVNHDGIGFMLEIMPQSGADDRMVEVLISLYANCPPNTGIQFHLFASPHIRRQLRQYANLRNEDHDQVGKAQVWGRPARNDNLFRKLARQRFEHLTAGAQRSLTQGFHYTIRDFRLMMSVNVQGDPGNLAWREKMVSLREGMGTTLRSASLPNRVCDAADLINWCSLFVNPDRLTSTNIADLHYDDGREIRDQIVDHDTIQEEKPNKLVLSKEENDNEMELRFYSIKSFPERFGLWQMGSLIGDLMQPALQYNVPFLLHHGRAGAGSEHDAQYRHGQPRACHPERGQQDGIRHARCWKKGARLDGCRRRDRRRRRAGKHVPPHGDMKKMKRVTRKTMGNAIHLAPLIAEWRGTKTPTMLFGGRRGQLMTLDVYDNDLGNYNFAIIGAPGSGKSVLMNEMAWSYLSIGARVWMLDLGRSFEKLCKKAGGTYIEFRQDSKINLNPFSVVSDERVAPDGTIEGGINEDIDMLKPALVKMCSMGTRLEEVQLKALGAMTMKLYKEYGRDLTITGLRDAFISGSLPELGLNGDQRIKDLAVMLNPYTKDGEYARFFEGRNNIDFSNDFMVIENEELKRKPELHAVVNILLMYQITGQMYLSRDRKKLLFIDELKQQLGEIGSDDPVKAAVVEEAARRARKYGGALGTATQSADDYYGSAQMEAALNCSDWTFLLRQKAESIELLGRNGRIGMDESKKRLLQSLRTEPGVFSECYISSPVGEGVARNILDPFSHLLFSNKLDDNAPLDELRRAGLSIDDAITELLRRRGHIV